jgi:hypothetical protein
MSAKNSLLKSIVILVFFSITFVSNAQDRIFTYTYQSTVLNKGQREIEIWNTLRTGREDFYARLDNRTEFEIGLGGKLQTSFYLNLTSQTKTNEEAAAKSLQTENEISFSNEWKLKLMDPVANPFGLALYGEYGIGSSELELEGKVILDKKINKLTIAANAIYEAELAPIYSNSRLEWDQERKLEFYLAFGYALNSRFNLTLENSLKSVYVDKTPEHSALFSGLGFSWLHDNFWLNFTVMPQLASFKGETNSTLNLNEYEKVQFRLLFSFTL